MTGTRTLLRDIFAVGANIISVPQGKIRAKIPVHAVSILKKQFRSQKDWKLALVDSLFL
jgi:hypothetical protein